MCVVLTQITESFSAYLRRLAKKEENPEDALKEFRIIVDQEEEKSDWYGLQSPWSNQTTYIVR